MDVLDVISVPNQIEALCLDKQVTDRQIAEVRAALLSELNELGLSCKTVLGSSGADVVRVDFLSGHDCGALDTMLDMPGVQVSLKQSIAAWVPASLSAENREAISMALKVPLFSGYCVETFLKAIRVV